MSANAESETQGARYYRTRGWKGLLEV